MSVSVRAMSLSEDVTRGFSRYEVLQRPDPLQATLLLEGLLDAGLLAARDPEENSVVVWSSDRPYESLQNLQLRTRIIRAAERSAAEWALMGGPCSTGPRQGSRGAFTDGASNRARARRRGKKGDRRRARHAAAQTLRTGVDRAAKVKHRAAPVPRQIRAPFLDPDDRERARVRVDLGREGSA